MKYCIFLCDHQWNIVKIMDSSPTCPLSEGARLPELLENPELLPLPDALENQVQSVSLWQLKGGTESFCAILCPFPRYHLVFLVRVTDEQGFTRFTDLYVKYLNWAQDHLQMPYTDEYSCIQQMNNQLINSQRALMKTNHQLKTALHEEVSRYFQTYPLPVRVHGKIGVCSTKDRSVSVELLCDRARLAADTIDGKTEQRIAFYDQALQERLIRETQMRNQVQQALEDRQFHLYVQPKVDMRTGEVIGAESLIRWIHPEFGFIPPDQFIPLLEEAGEIYPLDKYVWEDTCRLLQQRQKAGKKVFPISVNVARGDLYQKDLQQTLQSLLQKYELSAATLHLEVTERAYVHDSQHIFHILSELREAGFFIEMDDFGTGESSLAMVAEMPIDLLKLDRYFLVSAAHSKRHAEIIQFIIQLAQSLDLHILAEGVETQEQANYLLSSGCTFAQGYLYGKPMPAEEFLQKY